MQGELSMDYGVSFRRVRRVELGVLGLFGGITGNTNVEACNDSTREKPRFRPQKLPIPHAKSRIPRAKWSIPRVKKTLENQLHVICELLTIIYCSDFHFYLKQSYNV